MKKSLLLLSFLFYNMLSLFGQKDSLWTMSLEDIVIRENRLNVAFSDYSRNINVITKKQLEVTPAVSVNEALNYVPGVDIRQRGALGVQGDISIRGGTFEQTLVLINGIKMTDPQTGHHNLNLPLGLNNLEQVEVVKGPAARIYGQNAFSGAINFVTKVPSKRGLSLSAFGGQNSLFGGSVGISLPVGRYKQYLSLSGHRSAGYRENTDFSIFNIFYQSELAVGKGKLEFQGGYVDRTFGANGFYASPTFTEQFESIQTSFASLSYRQIGTNFSFTPRVYWRQNQDYYELFRDQPDIYNNVHVTNVSGIELNGNIETGIGTIGIGLEGRNEAIESTNLGDHSRSTAGLYAEYRMSLGKLDLTPGIFANYYSDYGINAFPGIDLGVKVSNSVKVFANAGYSYRIPTFTDLYYVGPTNIGNPNLQPEQAFMTELGVKHNYKGLFLQLSGYYQDGQNIIDWTRQEEADPWMPTNLNRVQSIGFEANVDVNFTVLLEKDTWVKRVFVGYHYITADLTVDQDFDSRYALEHLNNQLSLGFEHKVVDKLFNTIKARYVDRVTLENYFVVDTKLFWKEKKYSIFLEGTNLFNEIYTEVNLVPMPQRWVRGGVTINL